MNRCGNEPVIEPINFSRSKRGLVRADRFPEYIEVDPKLAGYASSVMDVTITFRCANGNAEYLVTGLSEGGNFIAQKVQQEPVEIITLDWLAEEDDLVN